MPSAYILLLLCLSGILTIQKKVSKHLLKVNLIVHIGERDIPGFSEKVTDFLFGESHLNPAKFPPPFKSLDTVVDSKSAELSRFRSGIKRANDINPRSIGSESMLGSIKSLTKIPTQAQLKQLQRKESQLKRIRSNICRLEKYRIK